MPFDWNMFRGTLSGGARELANECEFIGLVDGVLLLRMPERHRPLLVFAKRLRDQIGMAEDELRIIVGLIAEKQALRASL